jgi:hypothetical protein
MLFDIINVMKIKNYFILIVVILCSFVVRLHTVKAVFNCGLYTTGPVPTGYGAAYDVFIGGTGTVRDERWSIYVECGESAAKVSVMADVGPKWDDTQITYSKGYLWNNGAWKEISFSGDPIKEGSPWIRHAKALIQSQQDGINYFVAYTCTNREGWKCGCRDRACDKSYWQLQGFVKRDSEIAGCETGPTVSLLNNPTWPTAHAGQCYKMQIQHCPTGGVGGGGSIKPNAISSFQVSPVDNFPPGLILEGTIIRGIPTIPGFYFFHIKGHTAYPPPEGTNQNDVIDCSGSAAIQVVP